MSKRNVLFLAAVGMLVFLLLPIAVMRVRASAQQLKSKSNMHQIWFCMSNYDTAHERLPPHAFGFEAGTKLLSWRLAIQPFYSGDPLYNLFKLDEPWDSPSNSKWTTHNTGFLNIPGTEAIPGLTPYKVYEGDDTAFAMTKNEDCKFECSRWSVAKLKATPRGCTNLILCVETGFPVIWSKPEDIAYDPNTPIPEWKPIYHDFSWRKGVHALLADGNVVFLRKSISESVLRACIEPEKTSNEVLPE